MKKKNIVKHVIKDITRKTISVTNVTKLVKLVQARKNVIYAKIRNSIILETVENNVQQNTMQTKKETVKNVILDAINAKKMDHVKIVKIKKLNTKANVLTHVQQELMKMTKHVNHVKKIVNLVKMVKFARVV